jgi:mannose-6-phosphate isomerase-like protein (cupin superfamily)
MSNGIAAPTIAVGPASSIVGWMRRYALGLLLVLTIIGIAVPISAEIPSKAPDKTIVLIGGTKSHGPFEHDFPAGIALIERFLKQSPDLPAGTTIKAFPDGWPADPAAIENAATLIWYFDGLQGHPLRDPARRDQVERLMKRGVGLVALHQSSTLTGDDKRIPLGKWLGGARYGMVDRTTKVQSFTPALHEIGKGVEPFAYLDEFYPTIRWGAKPVTPILAGATSAGLPATWPAAWAFERPRGGRAFGFTGLHYLAALDEPQLRKLILNAIFWTAGIKVPESGVRGGVPRGDAGAIIIRPAQNQVIPQSWGRLSWFASAELGNSETMTIGEASIRPGQENPRHFHPNCDEILRVVKGHILHSIGDHTVDMRAGDTITIPQGVRHNARNLGTEDAVLAISFSSAYRRTVGE